jgi:hypothetical protein
MTIAENKKTTKLNADHNQWQTKPNNNKKHQKQQQKLTKFKC